MRGGVVAEGGPCALPVKGDYVTPAGASPTQAGTYYWVASSSGDSNNKAIASGCADEPVVIGPASPAIKTTQEPASAVVGATVKDKATLSGLFGAHPSGKVSWKLYDNENCSAASGGVIAEDAPSAITGTGASSTPPAPTPTQAGTYYGAARSSGDANNKAAATGCADEPVVIGQAQPKVETTQDPASGTVGDTFKDNAKLSG